MQKAFTLEIANTLRYAPYLFDQEGFAFAGADIASAVLEARSPRISDLSQRTSGNPARYYGAVQRFLDRTDPPEALLRRFQADAPLVLCRAPQAGTTPRAGILRDG